MRLAAIDIGSNAVRCLISEVNQDYARPLKLKLLRIPIRLGMDTFTRGHICPVKRADLIRTLQIYQLLMEIYKVEDYRACATSAVRDASNADEIVSEIRQLTGIEIEVIDGKEEASIVFETHISQHLNPDRSYLYIDVGGGSTDLTLFARGGEKVYNSFNIGTVRLMMGKVSDSEWNRMKDWLASNAGDERLIGVGSGGNINTIFQISRRKSGAPLTYEFISGFCSEINALDLTGRMRKYGMKPDRADVIGYACKIFTSIMEWTGIRKMKVPQIGLADGIIQLLAEKHGYNPKGPPVGWRSVGKIIE